MPGERAKGVAVAGLAGALVVALGTAACSSSPSAVVGAGQGGKPSRSTIVSSSKETATTSTTEVAPSAGPSTRMFQYGGIQPVTVTLAPASGPVGTFVRVTGHGFTGEAGSEARGHAYFFALSNEGGIVPGCSLISAYFRSDEPQVGIDQAGNLVGSFRVPARGFCFQQDKSESDRPLTPGDYGVILGPHPAWIGAFHITGS